MNISKAKCQWAFLFEEQGRIYGFTKQGSWRRNQYFWKNSIVKEGKIHF